MAIIKNNSKKYFKNDLLKNKIGEIEQYYSELPGANIDTVTDKRSAILH